MKRWKERLWAKILAGVLFLVFLCTAVLGGIGLAVMGYNGCWPGSKIEETESYYYRMYGYAGQALNLYTYEKDSSELSYLEKQSMDREQLERKNLLRTENTPFRYVILNWRGTKVLDGNVDSAESLQEQVENVWYFQYYCIYQTSKEPDEFGENEPVIVESGLELLYRDGDAGSQYNPDNTVHSEYYDASSYGGYSDDEYDYERQVNYIIQCGTMAGAWTGAKTDSFMAISAEFSALQQAFPYLVAAACVGFVLTIAALIFLCASAGHKRGVEGISLNRFDKLWLEPVLCLAAVGVAVGLLPLELGWYGGGVIAAVIKIEVAVAVGGSVCLLCLMTILSRCKGHAMWHSTLLYRLFRLFRRCWQLYGSAVKHIRFTWKIAAVFVVWLLLRGGFLSWYYYYEDGWLFLWQLLLDAAALLILMWWGECFLRLKKGGEALAAGDLEYQVNTERMYPDLKEHGENLNAIADGMGKAVEARMKSDNLRTELITNVSHDIKTPLTSIINYVDLLQTDPTPEQREEYLEVLARQAGRLKKLTEDLVEASKASTGNISVNLAPVNVQELVRQAVGEYGPRLEQAGLVPMVALPEEPIHAMADGRQLWRVLDNLLSNACKYALPGTRLYLSAAVEQDRVVIGMKNISREALNISAEELMERFVRGDRSRNTEGSGLGLSIARSLTQLQGGEFDLKIDGDLFKAEVRLRLVNEE